MSNRGNYIQYFIHNSIQGINKTTTTETPGAKPALTMLRLNTAQLYAYYS